MTDKPHGRRNSTKIDFRISNATRAALDIAAKQRGCTVAEIIRTFLATGLALEGIDVQRTAAVEGA